MLAPASPSFRRAATLCAVGAVLISTSLPAASDASGWDSGTHSAVRLIAARDPDKARSGALRAGVEIKLQPGWKTYWRYPGDSGVPPRFDFSGSRNVRDVAVLWPAPTRFRDAGGTSIGYAERVIFPLRIEPADPGAPVALSLKLDYAICEKLCVPAEAVVQIALPAQGGDQEAALAAGETRVPRPAALAAVGPLSIVSVQRQGADRARIVVDVKSANADAVDLFAEGPTAEWSLPLPEPMAGAPPGMRRFAFDLDGYPPGADPRGAQLRLTAVSSTGAIEVMVHLD